MRLTYLRWLLLAPLISPGQLAAQPATASQPASAPGPAATQTAAGDDLHQQMAELQARLAALEARHAEEREHDQKRIAELEAARRRASGSVDRS